MPAFLAVKACLTLGLPLDTGHHWHLYLQERQCWDCHSPPITFFSPQAASMFHVDVGSEVWAGPYDRWVGIPTIMMKSNWSGSSSAWVSLCIAAGSVPLNWPPHVFMPSRPHCLLQLIQSSLWAQVVLVVRTLPAKSGDVTDASSISRSGRSLGGRNGSLL